MTDSDRGEPALDVSPQAAPRQGLLTAASQGPPTTGALLPRETSLGLDRSSAPRNNGSVRLGPPADRLLVPQWAYACVAAVPLSRPAAWLAASGASFVAGP